MRIKDNVNLLGLQPEILTAIIIISSLEDNSTVFTLTSGTDDAKGRVKHSRHKSGLAIDFTVSPLEATETVYKVVKKALGNNYDVVYHDSHIHVEYDPE